MLKLMNNKIDSCLELEFSNPEYFKVHHISVLAFTLQTGGYTQAYQKEALNMLKDFLSHLDEVPSKSTIKAINTRFSAFNRKENIFAKKSGEILKTKMTILEVRLDTPSHYREDIVAWAKSVVEIF